MSPDPGRYSKWIGRGETEMPVPELDELKDKIQGLREKLDTVTDDEWRAYVKVRDMLAFEPDGPFPPAVRCAMLGIFETSGESGTFGEYDAGAVQRFADLGE
jgi:hypothetical protein